MAQLGVDTRRQFFGKLQSTPNNQPFHDNHQKEDNATIDAIKMFRYGLVCWVGLFITVVTGRRLCSPFGNNDKLF